MRSFRLILPVSLVSLLATPIASAAIVPGRVVVRVGDTPTGAPAPVTSLRAPFAESGGAVGFSGVLMGGQNFVFRDDQIIFLNSDEMTVTLGTHEIAMGTGEGDLYIISPSINGDDGLYANGTVLGVSETPAPGLPGFDATFFARPAMVDGGVAHWLMGIAPTGSTSTQNRVIMTSPDGTAASAVPVVQGGQVVGAFTIDDALGQEGVQDEFQVSYDANHFIVVVDLTEPAEAIYVDGEIVARELVLSSDGVTSWENFDLVAIDSAGNYAFSGDVDDATAAGEFVAYNGNIVAREGGTLAGVNIPSGATVRGVSLDDNGNMMHIWGGGGMTETAFYSCGLGLSPMNTLSLIAVTDELDLDGDGDGDGIIVTDLLATSTAAQRALANDGSMYFEAMVTSDDGVSSSEAIIEVPAPSCCGNAVVEDGEACDDGNLDDTDACIACVAAVCGDGIVQAGVEECDDAGESETCDDDCTFAVCGDGNTNETAGEECDAGGDSPTCDADCTFAVCGDAYVNTMAGETCDEGTKTATCNGNCTSVECGDGYVNMVAGEMCDGDGEGNGGETATCDVDCTEAVCGDGVLNETAGEECDDGNTEDGDGCSSTCTEEVEETSSSSGSETGETADTGETLTGEETTDSSSGDSSDTDSPTTTSPSGSASATSPTSSTTATTTDTEGETDTDTDTGGVGNDSCSCTTDTSGRTLPTALLGLLFMGALRRRRRS